MHTSFSFWPGSLIKKDVRLKFYQRSISNYKLSCELYPGKSLDTIIQKHTNSGGYSNISVLFERAYTLGLAALLLLLIGAAVSACMGTPLVLITTAGLYMALINHIDAANEDLMRLSETISLPKSFNECLDNG